MTNTSKAKPKRTTGFSLMRFLMPQNPLVHYISPLSPAEIIVILEGLGSREPLTAKVQTIETPTGILYKFQIFQRYTIVKRASSSPKKAIANAFGEPLSRAGEKGVQGVLTGLFQATENNQTIFTFNPGPQTLGCVIVAWGIFLFLGILAVPTFTLVVKGLLTVLLILVGVLIFQFMPMLISNDLGYHFAPGNRLGDLMVLKLQVKPLPRKAAAGTQDARLQEKVAARAKAKKEKS